MKKIIADILSVLLLLNVSPIWALDDAESVTVESFLNEAAQILADKHRGVQENFESAGQYLEFLSLIDDRMIFDDLQQPIQKADAVVIAVRSISDDFQSIENTSPYPLCYWMEAKRLGGTSVNLQNHEGSLSREGANELLWIVRHYSPDPTFSTAIQRLYADGILEGYSDTLEVFLTDQKITRAEFSALICRTLGLQPKITTEVFFPDVRNDDWAAGFISLLAMKGSVNGYEDGNFCPDQNITWDEAVKILISAAGLELPHIEGSYPDYYRTSMQFYDLYRNLGNVFERLVQMDAPVSRGEAIQMMYNLLYDSAYAMETDK